MSLAWTLSFGGSNIIDQGTGGMFTYSRELGEQLVTCVICLSEVGEGEQIWIVRCSHAFHRSCMDKWLRYPGSSCPLCRSYLKHSLGTKEKLRVETEDEEDGEDEDGEDDEGARPPMLAFVLSEWMWRCMGVCVD